MVRARDRKIAAVYSRVSGAHDRREASLESQEEAGARLAGSRGYDVPPDYRLRERFTGMESIYDRAVLGQLRDLAEAGEIDAVVCYDTDRLARDPRQLMAVVADLAKRGVEVLFVKCDVETKGRLGELMLAIKGFASASEWDGILDRTTRGRQKLAGRGLYLGAGSVKYGYVWDKETRARTADPDAAPIVVELFERMAGGESAVRLAADLDRRGVPSPFAHMGRGPSPGRWWGRSIRRLIADRTYLGEATARQTASTEGRRKDGHSRRRRLDRAEQQVLDDGRTEALITPELFDRANRVLAALDTRNGRPATRRDHLLTGVARCGECGARMYGASCRTSRLYRCSDAQLTRPKGCKRVAGAVWVEALAWAEIERKVLTPGFLEEETARLIADDGTARLKSDLAAAESTRARIRRDADKLIDLQMQADGSRVAKDAFRDRMQSLDAQADDLDAHIADLEGRIEECGGRGALIAAFMAGIAGVRARAAQGALTAENKRDIIEVLCVDVLIFCGEHRVEVHLPLSLRGSTKVGRTLTSSSEFRTTPRDHDVIVLESDAA